jgi:hypothetical protein
MAGWQEELAMLLSELGVTQQEPQTHLQPTRKRVRSDVKWREQAVNDLFWEGDNVEDDDAWLDDPVLMRLEVESIVSQVIRLMQRGDLDKSSKEDVMVVLHALRRRSTAAQQAAPSDEAHFEFEYSPHLEYSTAMLHFCRLVLRLSESAIEDL